MPEFRPMPLRPPVGKRDSEELVNDFCLALRNVGAQEYGGPGLKDAILDVVAIVHELNKRNFHFEDRLDSLTAETGWLMRPLFDECMRYPEVLPKVRERDGVRRQYRCAYCRKAERPEDDVSLEACDQCLAQILATFETLTPIPGTVLFRTYNSDWRCEHADADTVLVARDYYEDGMYGPGTCKTCVEKVLHQRHS